MFDKPGSVLHFVYFELNRAASQFELTCPEECITPQVTHGAIDLVYT